MSDLTQSVEPPRVDASLGTVPLDQGLIEVTETAGAQWKNYRLLGATREGVAPAKESVGKHPERYTLIHPGTVFYNPMRIKIGSVALLEDGEEPAIISPDYVAVRTVPGRLHYRWFYYWLRSPRGLDFVHRAARGAVRERLLFQRLITHTITEVPSWPTQLAFATKLLRASKMEAAAKIQHATCVALPSVLIEESVSAKKITQAKA